MDWDAAIDLYLLEHEANGRSPHTLRWHRFALGKFTAWNVERGKVGPGELKSTDLTLWLAWLRTRPRAGGGVLKPGSVQNYARSVKAFLHWATDQDIVDKNPAAKLRVKADKPLPHPFTDDELKALWKAVAREAGKRGASNRAILAFLVDTGCRAGEVCGVKPGDFIWDQKMVLVSGKTGERMVAFSPRTALLLKKWAAFRDKDCPAFFQTSRKGTWRPNGLLHWTWRLAGRAGVKGAHPHRFRATYATKAAATGNLFAVQQQLGHSTLEMTRRYAAVTARTIRANHDQTSPMNDILGQGKA